MWVKRLYIIISIFSRFLSDLSIFFNSKTVKVNSLELAQPNINSIFVVVAYSIQLNSTQSIASIWREKNN